MKKLKVKLKNIQVRQCCNIIQWGFILIITIGVIVRWFRRTVWCCTPDHDKASRWTWKFIHSSCTLTGQKRLLFLSDVEKSQICVVWQDDIAVFAISSLFLINTQLCCSKSHSIKLERNQHELVLCLCSRRSGRRQCRSPRVGWV